MTEISHKPPAVICRSYVYMAKMLDLPNCFKVGSTLDFVNREENLRRSHGACDLFLVGECKDRLVSERAIQKELRRFANVRVFGKESVAGNGGQFIGSKNSVEFFTMTPVQLFFAMHVFTSHCLSYNIFNGNASDVVFPSDRYNVQSDDVEMMIEIAKRLRP